MKKKGYSRKGFFGQTIHYDSAGNQVGESVRNFWGGTNHYSADYNVSQYSRQEREVVHTATIPSAINRLKDVYTDMISLCETIVQRGFATPLLPALFREDVQRFVLHIFADDKFLATEVFLFLDDVATQTQSADNPGLLVSDNCSADRSYTPQSLKQIAVAENEALAQGAIVRKTTLKAYLNFFETAGRILLEVTGNNTFQKRWRVNRYLAKMRKDVHYMSAT